MGRAPRTPSPGILCAAPTLTAFSHPLQITARKSADRLTSMRAQLNSVSMQLAEQNALARVSGVLQRSTEIQKSMAILVKAPEVAAVARQMAAEMTKAGMMSEMMDDTFATMEPEGLDEEADEEVARVSGNQHAVGAVGCCSALLCSQPPPSPLPR